MNNGDQSQFIGGALASGRADNDQALRAAQDIAQAIARTSDTPLSPLDRALRAVEGAISDLAITEDSLHSRLQSVMRPVPNPGEAAAKNQLCEAPSDSELVVVLNRYAERLRQLAEHIAYTRDRLDI